MGDPPSRAASWGRALAWTFGVIGSLALLAGTIAVVAQQSNHVGSEIATGAFTIYGPELGASCNAPRGFEDITADTQVVVADVDGHELTRGSLGVGVFYDKQNACQFRFALTIPGGHDYYVVSVGQHGGGKYTWERLTTRCAIDLAAGDVPVAATAVLTCAGPPVAPTTRPAPPTTLATPVVAPPPTPPEITTIPRDRAPSFEIDAIKHPSAIRQSARQAQLAAVSPAEAVALYRAWKQAASHSVASTVGAAKRAQAAGNEAAVVAACSTISRNIQSWATAYASAPNAATRNDADDLLTSLAALAVSCDQAPVLEPEFSDAIANIESARARLTRNLDLYAATG